MTENVIQEKSYGFALQIVHLYKFFSVEKKEFVLSKQILIAGTYVGAHVKAAQEAESKSVFIHEMSIALQKASETEYWLQLLHDADYIDDKTFESICADCVEIMKLLTSIIKTSKRQS